MSTTLEPVTTAAAFGESRQTIPFRPEGDALANQAVGVLGALVLLLIVCAFTALYAQKRGWLDRWKGRALRASGSKPMQVDYALRVSPRTTVYRISEEGRCYVLVESSANARLQVLDSDADA